MTREQRDEWRLVIAAQILAALAPAAREQQRERGASGLRMPQENAQRAARAAWAMDEANALLAENELHAAAEDETFPDGEKVDPRARDPHCMHGRKFSEPCADCEKSGNTGTAGGDAPN
jgi:hypothetical protein